MPRRNNVVRTGSLLFTIYGDYIRHRGGEAWVGTLIKVLKEFGFSEQAVRSALSRMCSQGWLRRRKKGNKSFYSLTAKSVHLLEEGARRIFLFQRRANHWDGSWHLVTYSIPEDKRNIRERLRKELMWMGYGALSYGTWISPHSSRREIEMVANELGVSEYVEMFSARHEGFSSQRQLVTRCWDIEAINERYRQFIQNYEPEYREFLHLQEAGRTVPPSECFVRRVTLIDEYRKFPFFDPELPQELLPAGWLGGKAAELFENYHEALANGANSFFDSVFVGP